MYGKNSHKHTGKIHSHGHMHLKSKKGKDHLAHASHHAANAEHDMKHGFAPPEHYQEGPRHSKGCGPCNEYHD